MSKLKVITAYALYLPLHQQQEPWTADDMRWFEANATRSHRVRQMYPDEFPDLRIPTYAQVIIRQLEPGHRQRILIGGADGDLLPDVDALLHAAFDLLTNPQCGLVDAKEIVHLAKIYLASEGRDPS